MPQISGEMLCRIIRKKPKLRNVYVVIVSGIAAEESVDYVAFGADACIAKGPFNKMADHVLSVLNHFHQLGSRAPLIGIVGAEDLYERHTTTELLISKRHYEAVIDNIREGILELTTEGRIIYANPTATDLIGLSEDELLGSSFVQFLPPSQGNWVNEWLTKLDTQENAVLEGPSLSLNSKTLSLRISQISEREDKFLVVILNDVTAQMQAEQVMRESYGTLVTVLDSIDADVYVADIKTLEILFANKHMRESFGDSLVGKKCYRVFRADSKPCDFCTNAKLLDAEGKPSGVQIWEGRNPVSRRWYLNCDRAIRWTDGRFVRLQVATDITRLKKAEERKTQLEAQLLQAQRLESIGTLAGGIAHNFNNLLMAIQGNATLMLMDTAYAHPYRERLESIEESVRSGSRLTGQLLGYAQQGRYEVKPVNLNDLVKQTTDTFGMARKEIRIHRQFVANLDAIEGDQGQIEQLLMNLYVNAADAMPQGGHLYLSTENVTHQDMKGKPYQPKPGSYVLLTVRDTGLGMDWKTQERIFEPFYTTKGLEKGTGLGLASVYGIVKGHGGYIDVDSSKGSGTTFNIYLPSSAKALPKREESLAAPTNGKGTILLVDDEEMIIEVGKQMLNKLGFEVLTAMSGEESLDIYGKKQASIDMVLLDMIMPDMGGGAIYDRLKDLNPSVKVLLSSGYSIEGRASEILARGCDGFIQKPFRMESLSAKVKEIIAEY